MLQHFKKRSCLIDQKQPIIFYQMKPTKIVLMFTVLIAMAACQKEDSTPQQNATTTKPTPTKEEMLAAKTWILSGMTCDPAYMGKTDLYDMMEPCEQDNTLKFATGTSKVLTIDEGSKICSGNDQQYTTSWNLDAAGSILTINSQNYNLKSLSSDGFQLVHTAAISGTDYTITETYIAK